MRTNSDQLWARWGAITRSLISTRVAVERERRFWEGLDFTNRGSVKVKAQTRDGRFTLRLVDHEAALDDEWVLVSSALVFSYSLAESAALDQLRRDSRDTAGVEDWGSRLLEQAGRSWDEVEGGKSGAVEVGVIRNLLVHGADCVDAKSHARLVSAGCDRLALESPVILNHEIVGEYRARLRSLMMLGGLGTGLEGGELRRGSE